MSRKNPHRPSDTPSAESRDAQLLSPEWVATFTVYWESRDSQQRAKIMRWIESAVTSSNSERAIYDTQLALRELGMLEIHIIKLILTRYMDHIRMNSPEPAQRIAAEVLTTLKSISKRRHRRHEKNEACD